MYAKFARFFRLWIPSLFLPDDHHGDEGDDDSDVQLAMRVMGEQRWNEIDKENVSIS